jgi:hypothetical protein
MPSNRQYWFGVGDGKIVFVYRLFKNNNKFIEKKCDAKKSVKVRKIPFVYQCV